MQPGNPDIREEVEKNRGLLKNIQLHIPLFKGYRQLEDLRVADELLRKQISDVLVQALNNLQESRMALVNESKFNELTLIASEISKIQEFQGDILHAQQGYSGISPSIKMDESKISSLYDYDLKLLQSAENIREMSHLSGETDLTASLSSLSHTVNSTKEYWAGRMATVKEIIVTSGGEK